MTAIWVLLTGAAILIAGGFGALTLVIYGGRALARSRMRRDVATDVRIPTARVVNR